MTNSLKILRIPQKRKLFCPKGLRAELFYRFDIQADHYGERNLQWRNLLVILTQGVIVKKDHRWPFFLLNKGEN